MYCPNCGKELKDSSVKFCPECGGDVKNLGRPQSSSEVYVPQSDNSPKFKLRTAMFAICALFAAIAVILLHSSIYV